MMPADGHAVCEQARALQEVGNRDEAAHLLVNYLRICPQDADAQSTLGDVLRDQEKWDVAVAAYENALTYDPRHFQAHVGIAETLIRRGWLHSARIVLETALADHANRHELRNRLSDLDALIRNAASRWRAENVSLGTTT